VKLITYRTGAEPVLTGVVVDERVLDISAWIAGLPVSADARQRTAAAGVSAASGGIMRWLQSGSESIEALASHVRSALANPGTRFDLLENVQLHAPVPRPGKIIGVGRNYADHAKETGVAPFETPRIIFKMPSSVMAPGVAVPRPATVTKMDFEAELAVVIGAYGKEVPESEALSLVAGYTILNDLSAREFQFDISPAQTTFAKSMDGFAPMGPWLVTRDEIPDPQTLDVSCWLNGARMQHGHTADMLFPVATLISYLSRFMTLEPGDVITTGTPAGVGAFRQPPVYLQPGDRLRFEVTRVGTMEHLIA
jgi:2-keto-4-pentenoate hydratase/2-oxohepta-3-ene-1,7-dioic acid hydratase in catechol pathway